MVSATNRDLIGYGPVVKVVHPDNDLAVFEQRTLTPKGCPSMHIHENQDERFYMIQGAYRFRVGEDTYEMKPWNTIFLLRNVPHAFVLLSEHGTMIVSYLPLGKMETFFWVRLLIFSCLARILNPLFYQI